MQTRLENLQAEVCDGHISGFPFSLRKLEIRLHSQASVCCDSAMFCSQVCLVCGRNLCIWEVTRIIK